jgi:lipoprotein-anchoring transpeptidase ErfK/SrfK
MNLGQRLAMVLLVLSFPLSACSPGRAPDESIKGGEEAGQEAGQEGAGTGPSRGTDGADCEEFTLVGQMRVASVASRAHPRPNAPVIARFERVNPQGAGQVFPLVDHAYRRGRLWYLAMLPIRPNGSTGWIPESAIRLGRSDFRLRIDLDRFRLVLFERCERRASYPIGVGTQGTPTPRGTFFLNSLLRPPERGTVYGAFAFGLSAFSDVITNWEGGGVVGLHGTNDPSSIGRRASHGCIRMPNAAIRELARIVPLGTLVEIG